MNKIILIILIAFLILPLSSASHYIVGYVKDAIDGTSANTNKVVLWNPLNGISENVTDIIGPTGNSGASNTYMIDCELLNPSCDIGDSLKIKVFNTGNNYVSHNVSVTVTGAGFDLVPNLTLNSPPETFANFPYDNYKTNSININFNCSATDLDSNLQALRLFGNWSGWHLNESKPISGSSATEIFSKTLSEGIYQWSCSALDNLSISNQTTNQTFIIDTTLPTISEVKINESYVCGTARTLRINCTTTDNFTGIDNVIIESISPSTKINHTTQLLVGDTYYSDIQINESGNWHFNCIVNDSAGNNQNKTSELIEAHPNSPDLIIKSYEINFSNYFPIENQEILIFTTVHNNGCSDALNLRTSFYNGPPLSGTNIGNITEDILALSNKTINLSWNAEIGPNKINIFTDSNELFSEINESNNYANTTFNINAWQQFYGNISIEQYLSDTFFNNLTSWFNETNFNGNIYATDKEAEINWDSLQSISRDVNGILTSDDFSEIDVLFNMTEFNDSVTNTFTTDGNSPRATSNFTIQNNIIQNVPIINSTNNSNFITGILWDTDDDTNGEYDSGDSEDLVFSAKINKNKKGKYKISDYEINIPVRLREYNSTDSDEVYFYYEII